MSKVDKAAWIMEQIRMKNKELKESYKYNFGEEKNPEAIDKDFGRLILLLKKAKMLQEGTKKGEYIADKRLSDIFKITSRDQRKIIYETYIIIISNLDNANPNYPNEWEDKLEILDSGITFKVNSYTDTHKQTKTATRYIYEEDDSDSGLMGFSTGFGGIGSSKRRRRVETYEIETNEPAEMPMEEFNELVSSVLKKLENM